MRADDKAQPAQVRKLLEVTARQWGLGRADAPTTGACTAPAPLRALGLPVAGYRLWGASLACTRVRSTPAPLL